MKIRFCGAARSVTGSCHMITFEGGSILWTAECGRAKTRIPITARGIFPLYLRI